MTQIYKAFTLVSGAAGTPIGGWVAGNAHAGAVLYMSGPVVGHTTGAVPARGSGYAPKHIQAWLCVYAHTLVY